jgi:hypothetical protein
MENGGEVRMTTLDSVCNTCHRQLIDHELTVADRPTTDVDCCPLNGRSILHNCQSEIISDYRPTIDTFPINIVTKQVDKGQAVLPK